MALFLAVDGGTESLRAMIFDMAGRPLGSAATAYTTSFPSPGRAEQLPLDWWNAVASSVAGAIADAGVSAHDIEAMSIDTTCCSVVVLDAAYEPLRPALIWMDVRAATEAAEVGATGDPALRVNAAGSGQVSAEWMIPKALWIQRHEPEIWAKVAHVCEYQDYVVHRLTGRLVASLNNVSVRWHYQERHGGRPTSLLRALGLDELEALWPNDIVPPGEVVGGLTPAAAGHLGLTPGMPVVQGGADAFIGMIGLGVTEPGEMALITGSSHLHLGITDAAVHGPGHWGTYMSCVYPNKAVIEGGQTSTGSIVNWLKRNFLAHISYDALNAEAAKLAPGSDGLLALDHFQGNRTPYTDPLSRGAFTGLSLNHGPAHLFRAAIEGVCLGTRLVVDNFGDSFTARRVVIAGGATNSPLWLQIHADTLGVQLVRTKVADAPLLGCAILAAKGVGRFSTIEEGCAAMVRTVSTIDPNPRITAEYEPVYARYKALYPALRSVREAAG